jgi:hypothetical protein
VASKFLLFIFAVRAEARIQRAAAGEIHDLKEVSEDVTFAHRDVTLGP